MEESRRQEVSKPIPDLPVGEITETDAGTFERTQATIDDEESGDFTIGLIFTPKSAS